MNNLEVVKYLGDKLPNVPKEVLEVAERLMFNLQKHRTIRYIVTPDDMVEWLETLVQFKRSNPTGTASEGLIEATKTSLAPKFTDSEQHYMYDEVNKLLKDRFIPTRKSTLVMITQRKDFTDEQRRLAEDFFTLMGRAIDLRVLESANNEIIEGEDLCEFVKKFEKSLDKSASK